MEELGVRLVFLNTVLKFERRHTPENKYEQITLSYLLSVKKFPMRRRNVSDTQEVKHKSITARSIVKSYQNRIQQISGNSPARPADFDNRDEYDPGFKVTPLDTLTPVII